MKLLFFHASLSFNLCKVGSLAGLEKNIKLSTDGAV